MLVAALAPGVDTFVDQRTELNAVRLEGVVLRGNALAGVTVGEGASVRNRPVPNRPYVSVAANRQENVGRPSPGAFFSLPPSVANLYRGQKMTIAAFVRGASVKGSDSALFGVFIIRGGQSGWKPFTPGKEFQDFKFEWDVPDRPNDDMLLIAFWPDTRGQGRAIEIAEIAIDPPQAPERKTRIPFLRR